MGALRPTSHVTTSVSVSTNLPSRVYTALSALGPFGTTCWAQVTVDCDQGHVVGLLHQITSPSVRQGPFPSHLCAQAPQRASTQLELWCGLKINFITNSWSWPCSLSHCSSSNNSFSVFPHFWKPRFAQIETNFPILSPVSFLSWFDQAIHALKTMEAPEGGWGSHHAHRRR